MSYFNIIKLDATKSSNDWLKERFNSGDCSDGDLVWVRNQTQVEAKGISIGRQNL